MAQLPEHLIGAHVLPFVDAPGSLLLSCRAVRDAGLWTPTLLRWVLCHAPLRQEVATRVVAQVLRRPDATDADATAFYKGAVGVLSSSTRARLACIAVERDWPGLLGAILPDMTVDVDYQLMSAAIEYDRGHMIASISSIAIRHVPANLALVEFAKAAAWRGAASALRALLQLGVSPSARVYYVVPSTAEHAFTPLLHVAIANHQSACAYLLLDAGCRVPDGTYVFAPDARSALDAADEEGAYIGLLPAAEERMLEYRFGLCLSTVTNTFGYAVLHGCVAADPSLMRRIAGAIDDPETLQHTLAFAAAVGDDATFMAILRHHRVPADDGAWAPYVMRTYCMQLFPEALRAACDTYDRARHGPLKIHPQTAYAIGQHSDCQRMLARVDITDASRGAMVLLGAVGKPSSSVRTRARGARPTEHLLGALAAVRRALPPGAAPHAVGKAMKHVADWTHGVMLLAAALEDPAAEAAAQYLEPALTGAVNNTKLVARDAVQLVEAVLARGATVQSHHLDAAPQAVHAALLSRLPPGASPRAVRAATRVLKRRR